MNPALWNFNRRRKLLGPARLCVSLYAAQGVEGVPEELVSRIKRELRIRRRVEVLRIPGINASLTLGIFRPVVFLLADCSDEELELVLRHEFTHSSILLSTFFPPCRKARVRRHVTRGP